MENIQNQLDRILDDHASKWNDSHDNLLKLWRKQASINLWLQLASNYFYTRLNDYLSYPAIIVSAATSIGVFGSDDSLKGKFAISILALVSGILTAVNKHCRAAEKGQEYALRAKDYYTFIREIDFILSRTREERPPMTETLERVKSTYDRIVDMQMEPPIHVIRDYEKKFRPLEASLFSDLQSEIRSNSSSSSSRTSLGPRDIEKHATNINQTPKKPPHMIWNDNPFSDSSTRPANFSKIYQTKKQPKNAIFSPYQLFSTNPMRLDEYALTTQTSYGVPHDRPSYDGRGPRPSIEGRGHAILKKVGSARLSPTDIGFAEKLHKTPAPIIKTPTMPMHHNVPTIDIELASIESDRP